MGLDRRDFLKLSAVVTASSAAGCGDLGDAALVDRAVFAQGVASGDPRPDAVVLWTRAQPPSGVLADMPVRLEVSTRRDFTKLLVREPLVARASEDNVLKVKVLGLAPRTTYHYRFIITRGTAELSSPIGRTRTAPAASDTKPVKLAFASCQDYTGRYYNTWQALLARDEDLDFILFLGDAIYETTGDPSFMSAPGARNIVLEDTAGALALGTPASPFFAARSLANYRQIHRTYRACPILQQVHERYPFIVMWDDHEFSNDCWGAHATYTNGAVDELDEARRRNAERAFFEYMPIDPPLPAQPERMGQLEALPPSAAPVYPNTRIFRDFTFGAHLQLALLDCRTHRARHLVPEDAYPGTVFLDAAGNAALVASRPEFAVALAARDTDAHAYININDTANAPYKQALLTMAASDARAAGVAPAMSEARAAAVVKGNLAVQHINTMVQRWNAELGIGGTPLSPVAAAGLPRGLAFVHLGKQAFFSSLGARYIVVGDVFEIYAHLLMTASNGQSEDALGAAQEAWFDGVLARGGNTRWTLVGSSVSMTEMALDLRQVPLIPEAQRSRLLFSADQWDGFPNKKRALLARMAAATGGRAVCLAGDIHASFASLERGAPNAVAVPCLTAPAISSATASEVANAAVAGVGLDPKEPGVALLVASLDNLFSQANSGIALADTRHHGTVVLEVKAEEILATYHLLPATLATTSFAGRQKELIAQAVTRALRVTPGQLAPV